MSARQAGVPITPAIWIMTLCHPVAAAAARAAAATAALAALAVALRAGLARLGQVGPYVCWKLLYNKYVCFAVAHASIVFVPHIDLYAETA